MTCGRQPSLPITGRPWRLPQASPAVLAIGTSSRTTPRSGEPLQGSCLPAARLASEGGGEYSAGCRGGGRASHAETCWPRIPGLLAPASQPLSLGHRNGRSWPFLCGSCSISANSLARTGSRRSGIPARCTACGPGATVGPVPPSFPTDGRNYPDTGIKCWGCGNRALTPPGPIPRTRWVLGF
jgi:hypothetical protein